MISITPPPGEPALEVDARVTTREEFDRLFDMLSLAAEALWPTPDETPDEDVPEEKPAKPPRNANERKGRGWSPEQREAQAERMRVRMAKKAAP